MRIKYTVGLVFCLLLNGCAAVPSCTVGVSFFGPVPVPTASCDITLYPADDDEEEE